MSKNAKKRVSQASKKRRVTFSPSSKKLSLSELRAQIYGIFDKVISTGIPIEIERRGTIVRIVPENRPSKLERIRELDCLLGDPEDLLKISWESEWRGRDLP